jgi:type IV pilus assembly protein PilM
MGLFSNRTLSVDFGNNYLKFAVGEYKNNHLVIDQLFSQEINEGVISNGNIREFNLLKNLINEMTKEKKVRAKNISFTLASSDIIKREVIIPIVEPEDEGSLIEFEIEQYLPESIKDYIIQSRELGFIENNSENKKRLLVAAMPKGMADLYFQLADELKLKPLRFDIHSNVISKLMRYNSLNSAGDSFRRESALVVEINHNFIDVFILEKGKYKFSRRIFSGIQELIRLRSVTEEDIINLNFKNVLEDEHMTVLQEIDYWIDEIRKIIKYYEDLLEENKIDKVILYGDGSLIKGIETSFANRLGIKTELFEVNNVVDLNDKTNSEDLTSYMNAIGALIDE